ncbi:hypothetical protein PG995_012905 [Apiospora arundinis]
MIFAVASKDSVPLLLKLPVEAHIVLGGVLLQKAEAVDEKFVLVDEATGSVEDAEGVGVYLDRLLLGALYASVEPLQAALGQRFGEVGDHLGQVEGWLSRIDRIDGGLLPAFALVFMVAGLSHTRSRGFPPAELGIHISEFPIVEVFEVEGF